jgi:hypothetical protein
MAAEAIARAPAAGNSDASTLSCRRTKDDIIRMPLFQKEVSRTSYTSHMLVLASLGCKVTGVILAAAGS